MQKTLIIGHLGRDAEAREVNARQFLTFNLAETTKRKSANGEVVESTTWYECNTSQMGVMPYLKKGQQVMVIGRTYANAYVSKQTGELAVAMKCAVQELQLLGGSGAQNQASQQQPQSAPQPQYPYAAPAQQPQQMMMPDEDGDLPF